MTDLGTRTLPWTTSKMLLFKNSLKKTRHVVRRRFSVVFCSHLSFVVVLPFCHVGVFLIFLCQDDFLNIDAMSVSELKEQLQVLTHSFVPHAHSLTFMLIDGRWKHEGIV